MSRILPSKGDYVVDKDLCFCTGAQNNGMHVSRVHGEAIVSAARYLVSACMAQHLWVYSVLVATEHMAGSELFALF